MSSPHYQSLPPSPPEVQPSFLSTLLYHLLPPTYPIPEELLGAELLMRHRYLPPRVAPSSSSGVESEEGDTDDGWMSLNPSANHGSEERDPISNTLKRLADSNKGRAWVSDLQAPGRVTYRIRDVESVLARFELTGDNAVMEGNQAKGVTIVLKYEGLSGWRLCDVSTLPGSDPTGAGTSGKAGEKWYSNMAEAWSAEPGIVRAMVASSQTEDGRNSEAQTTSDKNTTGPYPNVPSSASNVADGAVGEQTSLGYWDDVPESGDQNDSHGTGRRPEEQMEERETETDPNEDFWGGYSDSGEEDAEREDVGADDGGEAGKGPAEDSGKEGLAPLGTEQEQAQTRLSGANQANAKRARFDPSPGTTSYDHIPFADPSSEAYPPPARGQDQDQTRMRDASLSPNHFKSHQPLPKFFTPDFALPSHRAQGPEDQDPIVKGDRYGPVASGAVANEQRSALPMRSDSGYVGYVPGSGAIGYLNGGGYAHNGSTISGSSSAFVSRINTPDESYWNQYSRVEDGIRTSNPSTPGGYGYGAGPSTGSSGAANGGAAEGRVDWTTLQMTRSNGGDGVQGREMVDPPARSERADTSDGADFWTGAEAEDEQVERNHNLSTITPASPAHSHATHPADTTENTPRLPTSTSTFSSPPSVETSNPLNARQIVLLKTLRGLKDMYLLSGGAEEQDMEGEFAQVLKAL